MKARAWLLLILILSISFTGFSTTADLNQNSEAITISDYDVGGISVIAIVVDKSDFNINEANSYVFSHFDRLESKLFEIKELLKFEKPIKELVLIPPLKNLQSDFNIYKSSELNSKKHLLPYRRARDGIRQNS